MQLYVSLKINLDIHFPNTIKACKIFQPIFLVAFSYINDSCGLKTKIKPRQKQIKDASTLHHDTASPTAKLVKKTAFTDRKSVGKGYCRPILSVTESPVGKALSRQTIFYRPTVRRLWLTFPTDIFFPDERFFTDRHFMPTNKWTAFTLPTNISLAL